MASCSERVIHLTTIKPRGPRIALARSSHGVPSKDWQGQEQGGKVIMRFSSGSRLVGQKQDKA